MTQKEKMEIHQFATLKALKGNQFGKQIFTTLIKFSDLKNFLQVFPEVQRTMNKGKVNSIKKYILSGVSDINASRFFNGLTASTRGYIYFDETQNEIAIDTQKSKLSVNDGQHRLLGADAAVNEIKERLENKKVVLEERAKLEKQLEQLENMHLPVVIFNNLSVREEKILFNDINDLLTKPSKAEKIRLSQTNLDSKMTREIAEENKFLLTYGVEFAKSSINKTNPNAILLTSIYDWVCTYRISKFGRGSKVTDATYSAMKEDITILINEMFENLPTDLHSKGKYILSKGFALRSIFEFIVKGSAEGIAIEYIFKAIKNTDWSETEAAWGKYGARQLKNGSITFPGSDAGGKKAVLAELEVQLLEVNSLANY